MTIEELRELLVNRYRIVFGGNDGLTTEKLSKMSLVEIKEDLKEIAWIAQSKGIILE
jgi:hypothetical protein